MTTQYLAIGENQLAYDVTGDGPLVVLSPGIGDSRRAYRFLVPELVTAGYRVATVDLRGHGDSSMNWTSHDGSDAISRTDVAGDLVALIDHLGGPAVIVGHSISGGAATIAAATAPVLITAIVEINPFTKTQKLNVPSLFTVRRYRRAMLRLMRTMKFKSLHQWMRYLDVAYPIKSPDHDQYLAELSDSLSSPGRFDEFLKTGGSTPADAESQLPHILCPAMVIMGTADPDFPDPHAEGLAIVRAMPPGIGTLEISYGSGHYPHVDAPELIIELILPFLAVHTLCY